MKRVISLLLALVIMISTTTTSFATNIGEEYYTIQVEYSDNIGHQEDLDVMILNNNVFVDAKMLAERLGYTFGENGEGAIIYNKDTSNGLPFCITQFKYNSTQVSHMLFNNMIDTYEAPFESVKNSEGSWIPLEYSLLLINSGMMITDDELLIDIPTKRIIDYFYDIVKNSEKYNFDWADDFGYTETDLKVLGGSSHLINVFNGLLGFDGASWATLFQQFAGSMASYDKKYGENLAMLLCTESDKELQASIERVELLTDLLDVDGDLGKLLSFTSDMEDFEVGTLYRQCEAVLEGIKTGNSSAVDYSRSYQALENALDRQTWFSNTGGNILEVQKGVSSVAGKAFTFLDIGTKVAEVVGYAQEFQNQDKFSLAALTYYLDSANDGLELPQTMKKSMIDHSDALSGSIGGYMEKRFLENVDQWLVDAVKDEVPLHKIFGSQAAAILIVWDIASNTIPFIANGLSGADSFELALYSLVFQGDTYLNYLDKRDSVFADAGNITAENVYDIAQYCYIYLKSCYTTREAALASLVNKNTSTKEKIQPLIDYQNGINTEIAKIMVELKGANKTNDGCVFGFLPSDNEAYLNKYDNSQIIRWIETFDQETLDVFGLLPSKFTFTSGVGGWATEITLNDDGNFNGQYYDFEMGDRGDEYPNGTVYISNFSGKFTIPKKIDEYAYSMQLDYLKEEGNVGDDYYEDGIRYIIAEPYGFDNADEFLIYFPGIDMADLPEGFKTWLYAFFDVQAVETLPYYGIYNVDGEKGFVAYSAGMGEEVDLTNIYMEFLQSYSYQSYVPDWMYGTPREYAILDINEDGIEELIITGGDGLGFYNFVVFSYDKITNEIYVLPIQGSEVLGENYTGNIAQCYGGIQYSPKYHALVFTELNNGAMSNSYEYFVIDNRKLIADFSLWFEYDYATKQVFYGIADSSKQERIDQTDYDFYISERINLEWSTIPITTSLKSSSKTDLSDYIGMDILSFVEYINDMKDVGATDGSVEYSNGSIIVSAEYGSNSIIFISINGDCNYSIQGIEYGMSFETATELAYQFCEYITDDLPYYKRFVMAGGKSISFHAEDEKTVDSINIFVN